MAKIVIDIDGDVYNRFANCESKPRQEITEKERFEMNADAIRLTRAFCNGIPLEKVLEDIKSELSHIDKPEPHNIGYESGVYDGVQLAIRTIDSHISGKDKE